MDKPISVGDLVMVVRARECCGNDDAVGLVFRVFDFKPDFYCDRCGTQIIRSASMDGWWRAGLNRLKRLDPDALKDDMPEREELSA